MISLPEPEFIDRDPSAVTADLIEQWTGLADKTLYPGQVERVLIDVLAYRETLIRIAIQEAAKQNLLYYARAPMLDYLGELMGVTRLSATYAVTQVTFTLPAIQGIDVTIPAATQFTAGAGNTASRFLLDAAITIVAGDLTGSGSATAVTAGTGANGWAVGQLNYLETALEPAGITVANTTASAGGVAEEDDERLRERIRLAPESYTTAGSVGAYRYHALSVDASILDVAVVSPIPGAVRLYVLTNTGLPSDELLQRVEEVCSGDTVRPLCDQVQALAPEMRTFTIEAQVSAFFGVDAATLQTQITQAAEDYAAEMEARLGRDIVPSQIIARLSLPGVYEIALAQNVTIDLEAHEWAYCSSITITMMGYVDETL